MSTLCRDCTQPPKKLYMLCWDCSHPPEHCENCLGIMQTLSDTLYIFCTVVRTLQNIPRTVYIFHNILYLLCTGCAHALKYTAYTLYRLCTPFTIHCIYYERLSAPSKTPYKNSVQILHTLQNTLHTLPSDCTHLLKYTAYTVRIVYTLQNILYILCTDCPHPLKDTVYTVFWLCTPSRINCIYCVLVAYPL